MNFTFLLRGFPKIGYPSFSFFPSPSFKLSPKICTYALTNDPSILKQRMNEGNGQGLVSLDGALATLHDAEDRVRRIGM